MKDEKMDRGFRESPTKTAKQGRSCCALTNLSCINNDFLEDMTGKIGDLWLMISLA